MGDTCTFEITLFDLSILLGWLNSMLFVYTVLQIQLIQHKKFASFLFFEELIYMVLDPWL